MSAGYSHGLLSRLLTQPLGPPPWPSQVNGYYELLAEFDIRAPAEDLAAAACLDSDYGALRDAAWAAEAAKERHAEAFRWGLVQGAAGSRCS